MELEQVMKRVDWLDDERRKDKSNLATFEERLVVLEGGLDAVRTQIKELSGEISRLSSTVASVGEFENSLSQHRIETNRAIEELEKTRTEREREIEEVFRTQVDRVNGQIVEIRKSIEPISKLESGLKARVEEEYRLGRQIDELRQELLDLQREDEEAMRILRLLEESRRRNEKRLTDLQGEILALRKRQDEQRGKHELTDAALRKIENRVNEVAAVQTERQEAQAEFLEKQALKQVERDRIWKDWSSRFETIESQAVEVDTHLQGLDEASREVQQAKASLEKLSERVERRIKEITEMQRLAEDRFRQEWVTFKADDQKRWTNYTLTQEEQQREANRQLEKLGDQITGVLDQMQEVKDVIHHLDEQTEKRLQALLAVARDWVAAYERSSGRAS